MLNLPKGRFPNITTNSLQSLIRNNLARALGGLLSHLTFRQVTINAARRHSFIRWDSFESTAGPGQEMRMRNLKVVVAAGLALMLGMLVTMPAFPQSTPAASEATKAQAQALLSVVSQEVWHAQQSSTGYGGVQQEYIEGERAYFKGDYPSAIKHLTAASKIVKGIPNDYAND